MKFRLTQLDGDKKLPNLALMRLSHWHRAKGDDVTFTRNAVRDLFEPEYDRVYGSAIFTRSRPLIDRLQRDFPGAIVGGSGAYPYREFDPDSFLKVEDIVGGPYEHYDYSICPEFDASIGYTQRGCRFSCGFCPVPKMEGRVRAVATLHRVWRGEPYPKKLHLLDNDFFGQPNWKAMIDERFHVCLNQGINVRVITPAVAAYVARMPYYDDQFKTRRLYTAWDNIDDEAPFTRGVEFLFREGVKPNHLMVYMLVGYDPAETDERRMYRFEKMRDMGIRVYPMPYAADAGQLRSLRQFQKWVVTGSHTIVPFKDFRIMGQAERERLHRLNRERAHQMELLAS